MNNIVWKKFKFTDILVKKTPPTTNTNQKDLEVKEEPFINSVALITRAEKNNGVVGYIDKANFNTAKKGITYNDQFAFFLYHNYEFTTIKSHISIITGKTSNLKKILDNNDIINFFITKLLNQVFSKEIFGWSFLATDYRFDREVILLPCIECNKEDSIWEEEGKYYTLAVNYIESLMERAKERREANTIKKYEAERKKYEAERKKYEAERKKYEAEYLTEKPNVIWKSFKVENLFTPERGRDMSVAQKNLDKSNVKTDEYSIAIVTESTLNNGIGFYLKPTENIYTNKIRYKGLTYGCQFGNANYHNYPYYIVGNVNYMIFNNDKLYNLCTDYVGQYIAKILNKVFKKSGLFNYIYKLKDSDFNREYIILPCIETTKEESIWEERYTLAINYISYIYLSGRIKNCQRLIDNYTYRY